MKKLYKYIIVICLSAVYIAISDLALPLSELAYGTGCCTVTGRYLPVAVDGPPWVIAIDPGHGGTDTGALAITAEYKVIDTTASFLYGLLDDDMDFIPVYTRTDTDPSSRDRAAAANRAGAALLISIHANSDSSSASHGFECFPSPPGRTSHSDSLRLATIIAREMKAAGHTLRGGEEKTGVKYAYYYGNNKKIVDSNDDTVRSRKSFGVLEKSACPAVLVEQCFITNRNDVAQWASEKGCLKAAGIYYSAIKQYFSAFSDKI